MNKTVVIADIHGCYDELLDVISPHIGSNNKIIFLGDLIDRAEKQDDDANVLDLVHDMHQRPHTYGLNDVVVLKGNHEQLFLDAVAHDDYELWEWNGGNPQAIPDLMMHHEWIEQLPTFHIQDDYLFVHAGVRPNVPLELQDTNDFLWIRDEFLNGKHHGLPYTVVHGHSIEPSYEVTRYPGRISCDCGSFHSGVIGNVVLN